MGKTTLYHPISLHVVRGAAEYCGFKFGKIKQIYGNQTQRKAIYSAEIERMPGDLFKMGTLLRVQHDLQECFMDDIRIEWVHVHQSGLWSCRITIALPEEPMQQPLPNPDPSIEPIHRGGGGGGGGEQRDAANRAEMQMSRLIDEITQLETVRRAFIALLQYSQLYNERPSDEVIRGQIYLAGLIGRHREEIAAKESALDNLRSQ